MRKCAALGVLFCLAIPGFSATGVTRRPSSSKSSPATVSGKKPATTIQRAAAKPGARTAKTRLSARSRGRRPTWRAGQMTPTPERYQQIQQALIDRGYLAPPPSGVWGQEAAQAVKKFQRDQSLEPSGKLDSLTLISLGLGPRRESISSTAVLSIPRGDSGAGARETQ